MIPTPKRFAATLAGLSLPLLLAASASASSVTIGSDIAGEYPVVIDASTPGHPGSPANQFAGTFNVTVNGVPTTGLCIDPWDFGSASGTYNATTLTGDTKLDLTSAGATQIEKLMEEYYTTALTSNTVAAGLQIAIWETEGADNTSGDTFALGGGQNDYGAAADIAFVDNPSNNVVPDTNITVLQTVVGNQDLLIPGGSVPDGGATVGMLGLALAALVGLRRKLFACA